MSALMNPVLSLSRRSPRLFHPGVLALLCTLPSIASARDREAVIADAVRYVEHTWHEQGRLRVRRTARRPDRVLELPTADQGAYAPLADLAVSPGDNKTVIYLEPAAEAVSVVWADASP
jgi:hypothetical protein